MPLLEFRGFINVGFALAMAVSADKCNVPGAVSVLLVLRLCQDVVEVNREGL